MSSKNYKACQRYHRDLKARVRKALGPRVCALCGKRHRKLEAAHLVPTNLKGAGRGSHRRYLDILKHPSHYLWMGKKCHHLFDLLMAKRDSLITEPGGQDEEVPF